MSNKSYTSSQIQELLAHPGVLSCSEKYLSFTVAFKQQALDLSMREFVSPRKVFEHFWLPLFITETSLPKDALKDWKKRLKNKWIDGLMNQKKWRPKVEKPPWWVSWTSSFDEIEYLRAKVAYLEEENKAFRLIRAWRYRHETSASSGNK